MLRLLLAPCLAAICLFNIQRVRCTCSGFPTTSGTSMEDTATGRCYWDSGWGNQKNYRDAETACNSYGGAQLVSINDATEKTKLDDLIGSSTGDRWIGLSDTKNGDTTSGTWADGSGSTYRIWADSNPNNDDGDCVKIRGSKADHSWSDKSCDVEYQGICEKSADIVCNTPVFPPCPLNCGYSVQVEQESCYPATHISFKYNSCAPTSCNLEPESIISLPKVVTSCEALDGLYKIDFCYFIVDNGAAISPTQADDLCLAEKGSLVSIYDYSDTNTLNAVAGFLRDKALNTYVWTSGRLTNGVSKWISSSSALDIQFDATSILAEAAVITDGCLSVKSPDVETNQLSRPLIEQITPCSTAPGISKALCLKKQYGEQFKLYKDKDYSSPDPKYKLGPVMTQNSAYICGTECLKTDGCLSFTHNRVNYDCQLYSMRNHATMYSFATTVYSRRY